MTTGNDASLPLLADRFSSAAFYRGTPQREAVARMEHLIDRRRRLGVIAGAAGSGKSWILESLHHRAARRGEAVAHLAATGTDPRDFLWQLNAQLGTTPSYDDSPLRLWRRLTDRLDANRTLERTTVLLVDDVDRGHADLAPLILRIGAVDACCGIGPTVILSATGTLHDRLAPALAGLVELSITLEPWTEQEVIDYMEMILADAVGPPVRLDRSAAERLHLLSRGVPRPVSRLARLAWRAAHERSGGPPEELLAADIEAAARQLEETAAPVLGNLSAPGPNEYAHVS